MGVPSLRGVDRAISLWPRLLEGLRVIIQERVTKGSFGLRSAVQSRCLLKLPCSVVVFRLSIYGVHLTTEAIHRPRV